MSAPKRDKFAALAAAQAQGARSSASGQTGAAPSSSSSAPTEPERPVSSIGGGGVTTGVGGGGGGGKFAALQKANSTKRDKFSAMASRAATAKTGAPPDLPVAVVSQPSPESIAKIQEWSAKCEQRDKLWRDLEQAEVFVLDVLGYTQQTVESFARQTTTEAIDPSEVQKLSSQVQHLIRQLHDKLAPAAQFIQAYQAPERINKLYQVRVEEGLAVQKEKVLQELVALEKSESAARRKRHRKE